MVGNVSIVTNEKDINVKFGMYNLREERDQARSSLKYILSDMNDIRKYYIRLGFHLHEFERNKYYEDFGYITFAEFCDVNIGMDKGAVSRCINVFLEFNASNDVRYGCGCQTTGIAMELSSKYENYSYSQLCEMLPLTEQERREITPDMTVKQIREFKKRGKNVSQKNENVSPVATSQPEPGFEDEENTPLYSSEELENEEFIEEMFKRVKSVLEFLSLDIHGVERSGKQLSFQDLDGNHYSLLYRVSKNKDK